jgi:outer membrane autotransporter protein
MQTVVNTFNIYSASQLNSEVQKLAPATNDSMFNSSFTATGAAMGTVSTRLAVLRGDQLATTGDTGISAGDEALNASFWMKGFGSKGSQDAKDVYNGYNTSSTGLAFGADREVSDNGLRIGAAFSYANSTIKQQDSHVGDNANIKSYQASLYGMQEFGAAYVDATLAYTSHGYNSNRLAALARTAKGEWRGDQYTARADAGYRIPMGAVAVVPMASLEWSHLNQDRYTETGAGALNLNVNDSSATRLKSGLGARVLGEALIGSMLVKPEARLMWLHDFKSNGTDTTSSFTGGGASFSTPGQNIASNTANIGLGLTMQPNKQTTVGMSYDFEGRSGYQGHALQLTGRWDF